MLKEQLTAQKERLNDLTCQYNDIASKYKKLVDGVLAFSRGWMKIHNPKTQKAVTDLLTPLEYSIAMLACRDWTNQEIAEHMGMSSEYGQALCLRNSGKTTD